MNTAGGQNVPKRDRDCGAAAAGGDPLSPRADSAGGCAPWEWSVIVSRLLSTGPWSVGSGDSWTGGVDLTGGGDPWRRT